MQFLEPEERDELFDRALCTGNASLARDMIAVGIDVNRVLTSGDMTALDIAVEHGYTELVQVLLAAGANPNTGFSDQPLKLAAFHGHVEIVQMLLQSGARVNPTNCSALKVAARAGHLEIVRMLVEAGADANLYCQEGTPPLARVIEEGHESVFEYLAPLTEPAVRRDAEAAALFSAASNGKLRALRLLLKAGLDLNHKDDSGQTALMKAAEAEQLQFLQALLEAGADIDAQDDLGRTALMLAVQARWIKVTKALLHAGADPEARNVEGNSASTYAKRVNDKVLIQILQNPNYPEA